MRATGLALVGVCLSLGVAAASAADFTSAQWIWTESDAARAAVETPIFVRRTFVLDDAPLEATLAVTADNSHEVFVNGKQVGTGDTWNAPQTHDVRQLLVKGQNVIAIKAANAGGSAGLIARLQARLPSGPRVIITTGTGWKAVSKTTEGWNSPGYDDSDWPAAAALGLIGIAPWGQFESTGSAVDATITGYRPATEEIAHFELPDGFRIDLIATEPLIVNPV